MLHVIQIVMWGVAEMPRLFLDAAMARAAYIESTRKGWAQRYAAYCEHHCIDAGCFASAEAFVKTIDISEKSTVNYWTVTPEEAVCGTADDRCGTAEEDTRLHETAPETRATAEWKEFVALIQRVCCGNRNQSDLLSRDDWRQDIYGNLTALEYWDWVADRTKKHRQASTMAGYRIAAEEGVLGCYRFVNPEGAASKDCFGSEWEAWCAAGLYLKTGGESD